MKVIKPKIPGLYVAVVQLQAAQDGSIGIGVIDAHSKTVIVVRSPTLPMAYVTYTDAEELAKYVAPLARISVN